MSPAKTLILMGGLLIAAGLILWLFERGGTGSVLGWIGRLPGDIRVDKPNFHFYFPLTTCLLASLVLTALFWLFRR